MKKILFILGSQRKQSFNKQVAEYVEAQLQGKAEVSYLDYANVPFINQDIEFPAPPMVARVRETVKAADALWVFTPEYNFSYPGRVKNLFDWLSRPLEPNNYDIPTPIKEKKVAITGDGGKFMTKGCREKLTELLKFIGADVMEQTVGLSIDLNAWGTNKLTFDKEQMVQLAEQIDNFLKFIA